MIPRAVAATRRHAPDPLLHPSPLTGSRPRAWAWAWAWAWACHGTGVVVLISRFVSIRTCRHMYTRRTHLHHFPFTPWPSSGQASRSSTAAAITTYQSLMTAPTCPSTDLQDGHASIYPRPCLRHGRAADSAPRIGGGNHERRPRPVRSPDHPITTVIVVCVVGRVGGGRGGENRDRENRGRDYETRCAHPRPRAGCDDSPRARRRWARGCCASGRPRTCRGTGRVAGA